MAGRLRKRNVNLDSPTAPITSEAGRDSALKDTVLADTVTKDIATEVRAQFDRFLEMRATFRRNFSNKRRQLLLQHLS